jgi:hypothetical protein
MRRLPCKPAILIVIVGGSVAIAASGCGGTSSGVASDPQGWKACNAWRSILVQGSTRQLDFLAFLLTNKVQPHSHRARTPAIATSVDGAIGSAETWNENGTGTALRALNAACAKLDPSAFGSG